MAEIEVLLPKMGESVAEATITKWLKAEGDTIEAEESLVEIATDKVDSEVPAPNDGTISKILIAEGEVAQVGQVVAVISTEGGETSNTPIVAENTPSPSAPANVTKPKPSIQIESTNNKITKDIPRKGNNGRFYSPLVRTIAKKEGISFDELEKLNGTGKDNRVTKSDILSYVSNRETGVVHPPIKESEAANHNIASSTPVSGTPSSSPAPLNGNVEIIEMDRMRRLIADHMVHSKHTSPHVTSFVEADVTNLVLWREKIKNKFQERENEKITFTPIFIEAVVKALKDFPMVNVSVDGTNILKKNFINIGMAAALPSGNLIVPVIKNADRLNLVGLTKSVNDLVHRSRNNKVLPDEIQNGTFTVTNVGTFGNLSGTPIINQPQVAILATGAIKKKPAVIETPVGDSIGIRHMMFLSLSYDHRVVDGFLGGSFLRRIADYLEQFDLDREI